MAKFRCKGKVASICLSQSQDEIIFQTFEESIHNLYSINLATDDAKILKEFDNTQAFVKVSEYDQRIIHANSNGEIIESSFNPKWHKSLHKLSGCTKKIKCIKYS